MPCDTKLMEIYGDNQKQKQFCRKTRFGIERDKEKCCR